MSDALVTAIVVGVLGLIGVIAGVYVTWRVAKREHGGSTATSDAASLWMEGASIRTDLRVEIVGLRSQLSEAIIRIQDLVRQIEVANTSIAVAREETRLSREETSKLIADVAVVYAELRTGNILGVGELADRAEGRRIAMIPPEDRTRVEAAHVDSADPAARPARQPERPKHVRPE